MAKYALIVEAVNHNGIYLLSRLALKQYPNVEAAKEKIEETLGHDYWELLELSVFSKRWNDANWLYPDRTIDPATSIITFLDIGDSNG